MASSDVGMEDAHKPDPGNNIKESRDKVPDSETEFKGNDPPSAISFAGNADKSENGSDNKLSNGAKDQVTAMSELENQTHYVNEKNEQMSEPVEPTGEKLDAKSKPKEEISTEANAEVQTSSGSIVTKLTDANIDVESKNEDAELKTDSGGIEQKLTDAKSEMVQNIGANDGLKDEDPVDNGVERENRVENVAGGTSHDVAMEKPKDGEEDEDCAKSVVKIEISNENADNGGDSRETRKLEAGLSSNETTQVPSITLDEVSQSESKEMEDAANANEDKIVNGEPKQQVKEIVTPVTDVNTKGVDAEAKLEVNESSLPNQHEAATSSSLFRYVPANMGNHSGEADKTVYNHATLPLVGESDDGTPEEQAALMRELESFYRERAMDFKPPKFYGQPLNCLKLWRAVIRLGGYDRVTGSKLWRQVGESFHPPKTCTTVSWTFRIFYEKSLLEYEKHKRISGDLQLPLAILPEASGATADTEGNQGSGRARRDAAARAMQGWHVQRHFDYGEAGEPVTKDKNINNTAKREKNIKSIASLKQKRPNEVEHPVKAARTEAWKQLVTSVVDIGPPADWVKINVRQTKDSFEVYALIPGLLRNEVRVQSDPVGRVVITGQPEQADNPWGITPFKKVVSLPARIDPLKTSAVVSHHGRLLVRVPFESSS